MRAAPLDLPRPGPGRAAAALPELLLARALPRPPLRTSAPAELPGALPEDAVAAPEAGEAVCSSGAGFVAAVVLPSLRACRALPLQARARLCGFCGTHTLHGRVTYREVCSCMWPALLQGVSAVQHPLAAWTPQIAHPATRTAGQGVTHLEVAGGLAAAAAQDGSVHVWDPGQVLPRLERATARARRRA